MGIFQIKRKEEPTLEIGQTYNLSVPGNGSRIKVSATIKTIKEGYATFTQYYNGTKSTEVLSVEDFKEFII